jgi:hypothetical protein
METITHEVEFCVVGGGLAGLCAAIAAARNGVKVALVHDRPVLGGNASSEIRMWICGASIQGFGRETGIIEEFLLENRWRNPMKNLSLWDTVLYEKVRFEPNITLVLNASCCDAVMDGNRIKSIKAWQTTTQTWHQVNAAIYADCSGDSILAPLSGAEFRMGTEASSEFAEDIAPEKANTNTMGLSCLMQLRQTDSPKKFVPPTWAYKYETEQSLAHRAHAVDDGQNFWWLEIGGTENTITQTEAIRDELLKIALGVWDHMKNYCTQAKDLENWELDWLGFLPGKRESRRYVGDHILTQNDVRSGGGFADVIAFGGWTMDNHHPEGFYYKGEPTIFHTAPQCYGIPYRCVYSRNIDNLFFAGRNISASHVAMSSSRVMATCALLGQSVGTAATIVSAKKITPRQVGQQYIGLLQKMLMDADCYLPNLKREISELTKSAILTSSSGNAEALRNGIDRTLASEINAWQATAGDWVEFNFPHAVRIGKIRFVFDSKLDSRYLNIHSLYQLNRQEESTPDTLVRDYSIAVKLCGGSWKNVKQIRNNYQRLTFLDINQTVEAVKFTIHATHGKPVVNIYSVDFL